MNRREFIQYSALMGGAMALGKAGNSFAARTGWPIGCFNRPWTSWSFDETLKEVKRGGFGLIGLLTRTKEEPFIGVEADNAYLDSLSGRIKSNGLSANMGALRTRHDISLQDSIREVQTQIDNARMLALEYVLSFGADKPEEYQHYFTVMKAAASYAQDRRIKLAMKPHGGISGSSTEILNVLKEVNHPNFSIWYDAGNIVYYTGKDPVSEIAPLARHITGFCAKDCGKPKGDVMIQFGDGIVDFPAVFRQLKSARFRGPVMIECCKVGPTPAETTENAIANRKYLEKILASL